MVFSSNMSIVSEDDYKDRNPSPPVARYVKKTRNIALNPNKKDLDIQDLLAKLNERNCEEVNISIFAKFHDNPSSEDNEDNEIVEMPLTSKDVAETPSEFGSQKSCVIPAKWELPKPTTIALKSKKEDTKDSALFVKKKTYRQIKKKNLLGNKVEGKYRMAINKKNSKNSQIKKSVLLDNEEEEMFKMAVKKGGTKKFKTNSDSSQKQNYRCCRHHISKQMEKEFASKGRKIAYYSSDSSGCQKHSFYRCHRHHGSKQVKKEFASKGKKIEDCSGSDSSGYWRSRHKKKKSFSSYKLHSDSYKNRHRSYSSDDQEDYKSRHKSYRSHRSYSSDDQDYKSQLKEKVSHKSKNYFFHDSRHPSSSYDHYTYKDSAIPDSRESDFQRDRKFYGPYPFPSTSAGANDKYLSKSYMDSCIPDPSKSGYFCKVCESHCNSDRMWLSHIVGKRHLTNLKKSPGSAPSKNKYVRAHRSVRSMLLDIIAKENVYKKPVVGLDQIKEIQKPEISAVMFSCYLCGACVTSLEIVSHILSMKHQEKYLININHPEMQTLMNCPLSDSYRSNIIEEICERVQKEIGRGRPDVYISKNAVTI